MTKDEAIEFLQTLEDSDDIKDPTGLLESLGRTRAEAKENREKAEALETELKSAKGFKDRAKHLAVAQKLSAIGIKNPDRLGKLIDMEKVDFDDTGEVVGIDDQVGPLREEWPELFEAKRRAPSVDQFDRGDVGDAPKSTSQLQLQQLHAAANR